MLQIKNGKLYGSNYAFALPEGFAFNNRAIVPFGGHRLEFVDIDHSVIMIIYFQKPYKPAKEEMQGMIDANKSLISMGDFVSVKRGWGVGIGLYYKDENSRSEHYEERYDFKENRYGETQLEINISVTKERHDIHLSIRETLRIPNVKAFFDSIEYF